MTAAPAPSSNLAVNSETVEHNVTPRPTTRSWSAAAGPSRPVGASIRTRVSASALDIGWIRHEWLCLANIGRRAREYTPELLERRADHYSASRQLEFPNGSFVIAGTLLHHRYGPSYNPIRFKVAKHDHGVAQIAYIEWCMH